VGFTGKRCEKNIDDCHNVTCKNGGSCIDGINNFICSCIIGYTGAWCEADINDCVSAKCAYGSTCVDGVNRYSCKCLEGFTERLCESEVLTTSATESVTTETSTHEENLTTKPTTEEVEAERKTEFVFEVRVYEEWDNQLRDKTSEKYKELSALLKKEIFRAYSGNSDLEDIEIISLRPGSIIAEFQLTFKTKVTGEEALAPLKRETAGGKLGSLEVDPNSLKPKSTKQGDDEESKTSTDLPLVVGVSCGAVVILAVLVICIVFRLKRSSASHNISHDGDGVLADEAFTIREQYELKPTDSREEKIISMEEKGLCNEGM